MYKDKEITLGKHLDPGNEMTIKRIHVMIV
jgi:hypothetical protein